MSNRIAPVGAVFGRWEVVGAGTPLISKEGWKRHRWSCRCKCGVERDVNPCDLRSGKSISCGRCTNPLLIHGKSLVAGKRTATFLAWSGMKLRCTNPRSNAFLGYGMRGISVCDRWLHSYPTFLADMGERPSSDHSLDRIDVNGNYEPGNCRWATRSQQQRNRRDSILINGRHVIDVCEELRLNPNTVKSRIRKGWPESLWLVPVRRAAKIRGGK